MADTYKPSSLLPPSLPAYPKTVTAAGIIWIVFGSAIIINMVLVLAGSLGDVAADLASAAPLVTAVFQGIIGGFFLRALQPVGAPFPARLVSPLHRSCLP